jgi:hypothetical protein
MICQHGGVSEGDIHIWHCLGCGQQLRLDEELRVPDDEEIDRALQDRYDYWSRVIAGES